MQRVHVYSRSGFDGWIFWFESFPTQVKIARFAKFTNPAFKGTTERMSPNFHNAFALHPTKDGHEQ